MINVIGLGYIGLPTALMFAAHGVEVVGTDCNEKVVQQLHNKNVDFEESGMKKLFYEAVQRGIKFSRQYNDQAEVYIVAVSTPYNKLTKKIDTTFVVNAVKSVIEICRDETVLVIESTISPGTIDKFVRPIIDEAGRTRKKTIRLAHAPERIIPGNMLYELEHNQRTIGADSLEIGNYVKSLYQSFCKGNITVTDIRTAEMTKVVENTYRDINIAFANELAKICHAADVNVYEVIKIANQHPRVNILSPGPGVGGHCIAVDPWFLVGDYPGLANIILAARKINDSMPEFVLFRMYSIMQKYQLKDLSRVGLYGMTYKENVTDIRESPTLQLLECMRKHLAFGVQVYDPYVKNNMVDNQYDKLQDFLNQTDFVVIMVAHDEIIEKQAALQGKIVLDTRHCLQIEGNDMYTL